MNGLEGLIWVWVPIFLAFAIGSLTKFLTKSEKLQGPVTFFSWLLIFGGWTLVGLRSAYRHDTGKDYHAPLRALTATDFVLGVLIFSVLWVTTAALLRAWLASKSNALKWAPGLTGFIVGLAAGGAYLFRRSLPFFLNAIDSPASGSTPSSFFYSTAWLQLNRHVSQASSVLLAFLAIALIVQARFLYRLIWK